MLASEERILVALSKKILVEQPMGENTDILVLSLAAVVGLEMSVHQSESYLEVADYLFLPKLSDFTLD